ncbi:MAG: 2-amino-4-hydroxy-6-hydroxymethyldihydropteridine diphosphokinase [Chloracidobacterium sp.]|nr:2-amino-4-hydroxy-6-hydroxymethyldihydropteridine diphosphokinase [Chloracidobacterium sp.]
MSGEQVTAYVGLGSNLGDRAGNLLLAVRCMVEAGFVVNRLSNVYETEPVDIESDALFLNMAAELYLNGVSPTQMMARLLRIEYLMGRGDKGLKRPRTIDIDVLFYGAMVMETQFLTLPHPRLHLRKFVLMPMAEIAPHFMHPAIRKDITQMLAECGDTTCVMKWDPNT